MNRIKFNQTGGFPLTTNTLNAQQEAYTIFNALGELAGNYSIISGCEASGTSIADGCVYIDGELLPFKGGAEQSKVIVIENITNATFEDGQSKPTYINRYVTFGIGTKAIEWNKFKRAKNTLAISESIENILKKLEEKAEQTHQAPVGLISMWSGSLGDIPSGWKLCDGQNDTPDLSGKFIMGVSIDRQLDNNMNRTGGNNFKRLTSD